MSYHLKEEYRHNFQMLYSNGNPLRTVTTVCYSLMLCHNPAHETKHMLLYYLPKSLPPSLPQLPKVGVLQCSKQAVLLRSSMPYLLSYDTELLGGGYMRDKIYNVL
jgi:hypothetical protein